MSSKKNSTNLAFLFFQNLFRFIAYIKILFVRNQCMSSSAALSYTSLLALVPLLSLSFAILSSFSSLKNIQQYVLTYLFSHLLLDSSHVFIDNLNIFITNTQHLDTLGTVLLIASIMFVFTTIEKTFNIIWSVEYPRSFLQRILAFWALITLGPIIAGVGINIFLSAISEFSTHPLLKGSFTQGLTLFLPFFTLFIIFTLIYLIIPNHKVRFMHAIFGAFIAAFTLEISRHLFLSYITYLPSYQFIYKTLSTLPLFIVWMYIFWSLVLFGAQITASLPDFGNLPPIRFLFLLSTEHIFLNALKIIEVIHKNQKTGISSQDILNEIKISGEEFEKILNKLHKARIIGKSQEGLIFLIQEEGQEITLYEIYQSQGFGVHEIQELDKNRPWTSSWTSQAIILLNKLQNAEQTTLNISLESFLASSAPSNKPS
ncbi:MAG: YihY family inner membrane protein [Proteobacteria bacterium]|nr:YihY family inner membrane protein [Pseudomonadota bacterium]